MDKIILKDGTTLEFSKIEGLNITFIEEDIDSLYGKLTKENCNKIQLKTNNGEIYGIYNNLECTSIEKFKNGNITIHLKQLNNTVTRINDLEGAVADLGTVVSKLAEGGVK
ncbi:UNVERIFIED_ORG: hypothetical protein B2H93_20005 [Clostridium botulinum]